MSRVLRLFVPLVAVLSCLLFSVGARAGTVVVGSPLGMEFKSSVQTAGLFTTIANTALGEDRANVTSPVSGTVVRWRTKGTFGGGGFRLRVLRPATGGNYVGAGASSPQTPVGSSIQAFSTSLPIKAGDLIGLEGETEATRYSMEMIPTSAYTLFSPHFPEGSAAFAVAINTGEVGFDAEVVPTPTLILIGPGSGPLTGGTPVTIAGRDLEGATAVKFGANAASANFTVVSDNEITAVSPPAAQPGAVDITVTTPGGTSAPVTGDQFTYTESPQAVVPQPEPLRVTCTVPNLIGKTLKKARKRLEKADCGLGRVRKASGATARSSHVVQQSPKPGKVLAKGSKVNVKLG